MEDDTQTANPAYALAQLERALERAHGASDAGTRARAAARAERWRQVFEGMEDGGIEVGSRTPVADTPAWATLEVLHGGFATGKLLAGGALAAHEEELAGRLGRSGSASDRQALNLYFLSDRGREELRQRLDSGRYRVELPEEGALLVLAWLLTVSAASEAEVLLEALAPYMDRLRFYPVPHETAFVPSAVVHVQPVAETAESLRAMKPQRQLLRMREAITVWAPLYDRAVALFAETVEGDLPRFATTPSGEWVRETNGQPRVEGGWPCKRSAADFGARAHQLLDAYREARTHHRLCTKPENKRENFARLRGYLEACARDASALTGRDVSAIRRILACYVVRHGAPGSAMLREHREGQARNAALPDHALIRKVLVGRLESTPGEEGFASLRDMTGDLTDDEARGVGLSGPCAVPEGLCHKLARSYDATVDELVALKVVTSGEVLARVLPQVTAQVRAAAIADPSLRRLYTAIYAAFRRRRSLLLLNLQHQVRMDELPWVQVVERQRVVGDNTQGDARQVLEQVAALAFTAFPHQLIPNKLLQELRALGQGGGLTLPLVDELAADIFMGTFTEKFMRAAQVAAKLLEGSLYERYYSLPYASVLRMQAEQRQGGRGPALAGAFAGLCLTLARVDLSQRRGVAANGMVIEQQQVLTTQNLAVLFDASNLQVLLRGRLVEMAESCFRWVCRRLQVPSRSKHARLIGIKNAAYAWRHMLFYLSFVSVEEQRAFAQWARAHAGSARSAAFQSAFAPALRGLELAIGGEAFDASGSAEQGLARRFLGWTTTHHWLSQV